MVNTIYGSIYLLRNKINNKIYIGQTTLSMEKKISEYKNRGKGSICRDRPIVSAIRKHSFDNFEFSFIDSAASQEELDSKERYYISVYQSNKRDVGYNVESGGIRGKFVHDDTKHKISQTLKRKYKTGEMVPPMLGKILSQESIQKIRESMKGRVMPPVSEATKQKQSNSRKGWCSNPKCYRPILCVETGQEFETIRKAAIALNLPPNAPSNITLATQRKIKSAYGYTWKYLTESPWKKEVIVSKEEF